MKIALVTHLLDSFGGGVAQVVNELVRNADSKFQCKPFGIIGKKRSFTLENGYFDSRLGIDSKLTRSIIAYSPDIIHLHGMFTMVSLSALNAAKACGVPLIVSPHGMLDAWALKNGWLKKRVFMYLVEKRVLSYASRHHALNKSELNSIVDITCDPNKVICIPNSVDLQNAGCDYHGDRLKLKILFLGRLHPKKGLSELFSALKSLVTRFPDIVNLLELNVVGWGEERHVSFFKNQVNNSGLHDVVNFHGPVFGDDKSKFFISSDVFILPSFSEGLPMAVLEAWSYGLPVVMTRECNLQIGFNEGAAIEVEPNSDSIASVILELLSHKRVILGDIGLKGRDIVKKYFARSIVLDKYKVMYEEVLKDNALKRI